MNEQTVTQTHILRLLETGDLVPVRDLGQREAAQAYFRAKLLVDKAELQDDFACITRDTANVTG